MNIRTTMLPILMAAAGISTAAGAQPTSASSAAASSVSAPWTSGEVRKVDTEQGRITLKHGPITILGMPGMTMVFKAADPKMLAGLKEGDQVRFTADKFGGTLTATAIQRAP